MDSEAVRYMHFDSWRKGVVRSIDADLLSDSLSASKVKGSCPRWQKKD